MEVLAFDNSGDIPFIVRGGKARYAHRELEDMSMGVCSLLFPILSMSEGFTSLAENKDKARGVGGLSREEEVRNHCPRE